MAASQVYYIRARGENFGPYEEQEFFSHLAAGRVPFSAWVHFEGEWQLLAGVADLRAKHPEYEKAPSTDPRKAKNLAKLENASFAGGDVTVSAEPIWFVIRNKKKFGPYSAADIVGQIQQKLLEPSAFVWKPGFATWQKMSQVGEFSRESMKKLALSGDSVDILVKRKFVRAPYEIDVIAHDNAKAFEGKSMVIGEGGLFLATARPSHRLGARLKLHFREGETSSFNAVAEIVSVVRVGTPGYCLKFVALTDKDRKKIAKFVSERRT